MKTKAESKVITEYKSGKAASAISEILDISIAQVYAILRSNNIERRGRGRPKGVYTPSDNRKIPFVEIPIVIERYLGGEAITKIADSYDVSRQAIDSLLKTRGVHRDKIPFRKIQLVDFPTVAKRFHQYKNVSRVARDFSVSPVAIVNVLKAQKIQPDQYMHRLDLTKAQIRKIITRYKKGDFAKDIAHDFDLPTYSIWSLLHREGVRRGKLKPKKFALSRYRSFEKDLQKGRTLEQLAKKYKLSVGGVSLIVHRIRNGEAV